MYLRQLSLYDHKNITMNYIIHVLHSPASHTKTNHHDTMVKQLGKTEK